MNYITEYATQLHANGYTLLPLSDGKKFPEHLSWQNLPQTQAEYDSWVKAGYVGVGINCCDLSAIDLDVLHENIVQQTFDMIVNLTGAYPLERIGKAPKTLFLFRAAEPVKKMQTRVFLDDDGKPNRMELLGMGQQFAAFHVHPLTLDEYYWPGDSPLTRSRENLPVVTVAMLSKILVEAEKIMIQAGWNTKDVANDHWPIAETPQQRADEFLSNNKPPLDLAPATIVGALTRVPISYCDDYASWIKVGMACYHQTGGDPVGLAYWDTFSQRSGKYEVGCCDTHWESFRKDAHEAKITFGSVLHWAKEHVPETLSGLQLSVPRTRRSATQKRS